MKSALIYGSATGKTEYVSELIAEQMAPEFDLPRIDVSDLSPQDLADYEFLILGIPTWDVGELEYNWADVVEAMGDQRYEELQIAIFGLGDQDNYADTYQDAMGMLYDELVSRGATGNLGFTSTESHTYDASKAEKDGQFCGLAIDDDVQPELTEERVNAWALQLKTELAQTQPA